MEWVEYWLSCTPMSLKLLYRVSRQKTFRVLIEAMVIQSVALRKKEAARPLGLYLREVVEMKSVDLRCDARYIPNYTILEKYRAEECRSEYVYLRNTF